MLAAAEVVRLRLEVMPQVVLAVMVGQAHLTVTRVQPLLVLVVVVVAP
jgi:hypothetical protein